MDDKITFLVLNILLNLLHSHSDSISYFSYKKNSFKRWCKGILFTKKNRDWLGMTNILTILVNYIKYFFSYSNIFPRLLYILCWQKQAWLYIRHFRILSFFLNNSLSEVLYCTILHKKDLEIYIYFFTLESYRDF